MQDLAWFIDPMLHLGWRLVPLRTKAKFTDKIPLFKTGNPCQKSSGAKMNDFRPKQKNWVARNIIKTRDLAWIIDPTLHIGWRLVPLRTKAVLQGETQNRWLLDSFLYGSDTSDRYHDAGCTKGAT